MQLTRRVHVRRWPEMFLADDKRVITRFFHLGDDRARTVAKRVMGLGEQQVEQQLAEVLTSFGPRHRNISATLERHFNQVRHLLPPDAELSQSQRLLIGSYFTMEYSVESAALFNPSIVPHPNQEGLKTGESRFLMSLRATGEGHVSSIVFRTGVISDAGDIQFDPPSRYADRMYVHQDREYEKKLFALKLQEMGAFDDTTRQVIDALPARFTYEQLEHRFNDIDRQTAPTTPFEESATDMLWLARSNYHLLIPPDADPAAVVIFPTSENESRGIEDVRLTRFVEDDGDITYYGTYTAYNGHRILPQILETRDFTHIAIHTLNGRYVQNKGMALFPRRINGQYHMISRLDGENMFIMTSDNLHFWNHAKALQTPRYPWEFVQIGNCGAPIETAAGWILLTHGVGPMRQYCIGASLLDLDDPSKVIGHLSEPLIAPEDHERDGYVPNVVYSCGAMIHHDQLIIPYAINDRATTLASLSVHELIDALIHNGGHTPGVVTHEGSAPITAPRSLAQAVHAKAAKRGGSAA